MQKHIVLPLIAAWILSLITPLNAESIFLTPDDIDIPYQIESLGHPVMDGNTIVVGILMHGIENPELQNVSRLYVKNIITNESFLIAEPDIEIDIDKHEPAISGQYIVWTERGINVNDIYGYDLSTQTEFPITNGGVSRSAPDIDGNIVVWMGNRGTYTIYGYDLIAKEEFVIYSQDLWGGSIPKIHGNIVVWEGVANNSDIYGYNLETNEIIPISVHPANQTRPDVYGDIVVWQDDRNNGQDDIYGYNLETQEEFRITSSASIRRYPTIYGNYVAWEGKTTNRIGSDWDIFVYNLVNQTEWHSSLTNEKAIDMSISSSQLLWIEKPFSQDPYKLGTHELKPNSEIDNATEVLRGDKVVGNNTGALGGDITIHGYNDKNDVWYYFIPTETKKYLISLCGSDFDTTLAVFDEYENEIEFSDNHCNDQSRLILRGKAGKKYFIRIAGYDMDSGNYKLGITDKINKKLMSDLNYDRVTNIYDLCILANEWLEEY